MGVLGQSLAGTVHEPAAGDDPRGIGARYFPALMTATNEPPSTRNEYEPVPPRA